MQYSVIITNLHDYWKIVWHVHCYINFTCDTCTISLIILISILVISKMTILKALIIKASILNCWIFQFLSKIPWKEFHNPSFLLIKSLIQHKNHRIMEAKLILSAKIDLVHENHVLIFQLLFLLKIFFHILKSSMVCSDFL